VLSPDVSVDRGVTVIGLGTGYKTIDESTLDGGLREALLDAAESANPPLVAIDLSQTTFFGSSFIEILFRMWHRLQKRGGKLAICGVTEYCREVLQVAHLDSLWPPLATREEAIRALSPRAT
jgi:anti-anti-sigma factor